MNRYDSIKILKTLEGADYLTTTKYPEIPRSTNDYYVITTAGDRYDLLAQQFYKDGTLWWIIAYANNSQQASLVVKPGIQLRIPGNLDTILENYKKANK
jgi:nucleoid-associated protein YgaU